MSAEKRVRRRHPRHPAEVTAERLTDHYERWYRKLDGSQRDNICLVIDLLHDIAEGVLDFDGKDGTDG